MRKLGWIIIGVIIIALVWTILALKFEDTVGIGTKTFFVDVLGANLVNGITNISHTIMVFGTSGFPQAMAVTLGTGILFLILGIVFTRLVWSKPATMVLGLPGKPKISTGITTQPNPSPSPIAINQNEQKPQPQPVPQTESTAS